MFDPVQRLKDMDLEGIDTAVNFGTTVFLSLPFLENHDLACAIARAYNTWLAGYCRTDPRRLKGVALVAMQEPAEAVKELTRCVRELGFVGVAVAGHSAGGISIIPIFIRSMRKPRSLASRCASMSARAAQLRQRNDSTIRFSFTPRRMHSNK
jgi:hypothetical protein